jgi:hypothetical protein
MWESLKERLLVAVPSSMASVGPEGQCLIMMVGKSWVTRVGLGMTYSLTSKRYVCNRPFRMRLICGSLKSLPLMLSLMTLRNFTYVLNQLSMDTMAQYTSPTLSTSMTNLVSHAHSQSFACSD